MIRKTKEQLLKELGSLKERLNKLENADIEQKKVIEALSESEAKYRLLFDAAPVGIGIAGLEGNIIDANRTMQEMSGFSLEEYRAIGVGATYANPEERRILLKTLQEKGTVRDWEGRLKRKDGSEYYALLNADIMELGGRKVLLGIIRDISERKRIDAELRESEEKYRTLIENIQGGVFIIQDSKIQYINEEFARMAGYEVDDIIGKDFQEFIAPEYVGLVSDYYSRRVAGENVPKEYEFGILRKDGTIILVNLNISLFNYHGKVASMGILRDITQRKSVEEELKQSEEKYRLLLESIQEGVFVIQDAKMHYANQAFAEITGYNLEEIIGMDFSHFVAPEDLKMVQERYYRRQKGEEVPHEYEFHMLRRDGEKPIVNMNVGIVKYRGRVASMGILKDITEQKRAEKLIKQSEEKYRNLVELTTDIIYLTDKDRKHVFMNDAGYRILEALPEEVICHHWSECIYPDDVEKSFKKFREMIDKGIDVFEFENRYSSKSGKVINVLHNVRVLRNDKGEVIGTQGIARDITERKRIEKSLKLFSEAVESALDGIQIVDLEGHIKYSNKAVEKIYGFTHDELIGKKVGELNADPEIAEKVIIQGIIEKGSWTGELIVRHKEGHEFPIWLTTSPVKDETGVPIAMVGIIRDITERKRAEETLRLSNLVVENSQTVLFRWKAQEGWPVEFVSKNVVQFGYYAEDFLSGMFPYASIIHPDDRERVSKEVQEHSEHGDDRFHQEYRIIAKNGVFHWIDDRTVIERNRDGQITHYQGIIIDITERKQVEEAIKRYNLKLEESNRIKELFADIMHHDLLNPINVAHSYVELFLEDETNPQKKSYLETIQRNLSKGMDLIDNAQKFSKLESMKNIEFEDMDLKIVVTEAIDNLTSLAVKAKIRIENGLKDKMPARANKIIEDVFANLISNAIKYAHQGKKVVVDGKEKDSSWTIRVVDFGPGIKDADKKLVFERFRREEKKGVKGSGLGLAIAVRIVELHNGRIWVEDNPEGGAIFVVEIPKSETGHIG